MIMVGAMAATLWGIGIAMRAPYQARWIMLAILLIAVMMLHLVLPVGHPLRMATGGDARLWGLLIGFGFLVALYRRGLGWLRARVRPAPASSSAAPRAAFSETELARYARHIMLREIGGTGQKALRDARVLVVGAGGLGSAALQYLAAAGVGTIGVIDDDLVENSNLQRQIIHTDANIGLPKVQSAVLAMQAQNPFVTLRPYQRRLTADIAADLFAGYDLVLDGSDNFATRYLVNQAAAARGIPLIAAALTQWEGQISLYHPAAGAPCYACVFPVAPAPALAPSCAAAGVLGPLPGVIGAMMAAEAIKTITDAGTGLAGRLLIYDALHTQSRIITLTPRADCPICAAAKGPLP